MLSLTTGLPGHGKTLYTLGLVEEQRLKTGRDVYYLGVPELTLPWKPFPGVQEPQPGEPLTVDWSLIPDGAIVFIDEAWKPFPVRKQGSKVPGYVEFLATHRHRGMDIWLVTQHHQQLDTFVRKLIERHYHVSRKFGSKTVTIYQWEKVTDTSSEKEQNEALKKRWRYDEKRFAWYRSAFAHTRGTDFPIRVVVMILVGLVALGSLVWLSVYKFKHAAPPRPQQEAAQTGSVKTRWDASSQMARVKDAPWTAPMYDELNHVKSSPKPVGCMQNVVDGVVDCKCSTDQGTDAGVPTRQCMHYVKTGIYDPTRKPEDRKQQNIDWLNSHQQQQALSAPGDSHAMADSGA